MTKGQSKKSSNSEDAFKGRATIESSAKRTKKSSGKKSTKAKGKNSAKVMPAENSVPMEIRLTIALLACIALILSMFNKFGLLGRLIKGLLSGILGSVSWVLPVYILVIIIHLFIKKTLSPHKHRYLFVGIALLLIGGLHTLSNSTLFKMNDPNFAALCETHIFGGKDFSSGGLIGALLVVPLKSLIGGIGTGIVLAGLTFV